MNTSRLKQRQQNPSLNSRTKKWRPNRLRYERTPPLQQLKPVGAGVDYPSITRRRPVPQRVRRVAQRQHRRPKKLLALRVLGDLLFNSVAQKPLKPPAISRFSMPPIEKPSAICRMRNELFKKPRHFHSSGEYFSTVDFNPMRNVGIGLTEIFPSK